MCDFTPSLTRAGPAMRLISRPEQRSRLSCAPYGWPRPLWRVEKVRAGALLGRVLGDEVLHSRRKQLNPGVPVLEDVVATRQLNEFRAWNPSG